MQASQIKYRQEYAAKYRGREVAIRVTGIRTEKSESKTENYVLGYLQYEDTNEQVAIPVADVISTAEEHNALKAQKLAQQAKQKAEADALKARQVKVVTMLAEALGVQALTEGRWTGRNVSYNPDAGYVMADGTERIEINEQAWDALIALLHRAAEGLPYRVRVGPAVPAFKAPEDAQ